MTDAADFPPAVRAMIPISVEAMVWAALKADPVQSIRTIGRRIGVPKTYVHLAVRVVVPFEKRKRSVDLHWTVRTLAEGQTGNCQRLWGQVLREFSVNEYESSRFRCVGKSLGHRAIDVGRSGELQRLGSSIHEAFWVRRVRRVERYLAQCGLLGDSTVVNVRWCM
jgi:hypothetical protein